MPDELLCEPDIYDIESPNNKRMTMRLYNTIPLIAIMLISLSTGTNAQQNVFTFNTIVAEKSEKAKASEDQKIHFELNATLFSRSDFKPGAVFRFNTAANESIELEVKKMVEYVPGTVSIIAAKKGMKERVFTATYKNGVVHGMYHQSHDKSFKIGFDHQQYLQVNDGTDHLGCGLHEAEERFIAFSPEGHHQKSLKAKTPYGMYESVAAPLNESIDDSITIDLMIVYTDAAETWAHQEDGSGGIIRDIDLVIAEAMSLSQAALDNSDLEIELRLVYIHKTDYDETTDGLEDSGERLNRITQNDNNPIFDEEYNGYMQEVHGLRQQHGADIVSLLIEINDTGGLGYRLGNTSGSPHYGFNLNRVQQVANGYTLIHEIGHNMGNAHSRTQNDSQAGAKGGLFHYSAGYQDTINNFHTVMAYADGLVQAPIFSSPNLSWEGFPMGTADNQTPENNAMSMSQIKRTVAGYLPSIQDAPEVSVSTNEITVNINREDEITVPFEVSNNGESGLFWNADFRFPGNTVSNKRKGDSNSDDVVDTMEGLHLEKQVRPSANYVPSTHKAKSAQNEEVIYSTSFESSEGFTAGTFEAISDWRSVTSSNFMISSESPKSGSQHFRLEYNGQTNSEGDPVTQWNSGPFFGYQTLGGYEVSFSFEIGGENASSETFDFYFYDGKTGGFSAGIIIQRGIIYTADLNESGDDVIFRSFGTQTPAGSYHDVNIVYNNSEGIIEYFLNGNQISQNSYLFGFTPGNIMILHRNSVAGTYMNVDDLEIKQQDIPYPWLSLSKGAGVTFESESTPIELYFDTHGIEAGTYETTMKVMSNDPVNPVLEVPVTLNVNDAVSNEKESLPNRVSLYQNYPNPFNPTTNIQFELAESSEVNLQVFDLTGRKVATLVNGKQSAGQQTVQFDASALASGVYIYKLTTPSQTINRKMVLIK